MFMLEADSISLFLMIVLYCVSDKGIKNRPNAEASFLSKLKHLPKMKEEKFLYKY